MSSSLLVDNSIIEVMKIKCKRNTKKIMDVDTVYRLCYDTRNSMIYMVII